MRLATVRTDGTTTAVRIEDSSAVQLPYPSVRALLSSGSDWQHRAAHTDGPTLETTSLDFAPLVPDPEKIICVGLNYQSHVGEARQNTPEYPPLFAKFSRSLVGANDAIVLPAELSDKVDWEVELGVVIGTELRDADVEGARAAIAGYTIVNDISVRDWQARTSQFLQGKTFESSTPVGPYLITADEIDAGKLDLRCSVNEVVMQDSSTSNLIFSVTDLICYISSIITLVPGDLIATGTPGGVGVARTPPVFLRPDDVVTTAIDGLGEQRNTCVARTRPATIVKGAS